MRIWLDPEKMATLNVSADDIVSVIQKQNVQVAAGQIGQQPVPPGQQMQLTMSTLGRLEDAKQFGDILVKSGTVSTDAVSTPVVRIRDVARVELGAQQYDQICRLSGQPSVGLAVFQLPGSNALDVAHAIKKKMEELKKRFPKGLDYKIAYDTTPFIDQSVEEVFNTLRDAVILVAIVVLLVPAGLEGDDPAHDRRAGVAGRHLRRHGADGLQPEQPDTVRAGAGHRHRGR